MRKSVFLLAALLAATACQSTYYSAWEKLGYHKRDILVSRVQKARDGQQAVKEQFQTTLEKFKAVTGFKGGDLESKYNELNSEYDRCEARAKAVSGQIASVDSVANDLFKEWDKELAEYKSPELRQKSQEELRATESRYRELLATMKRAESKMTPVLQAFHDQVLFLKHNLNARAIASLESTTLSIQSDVDRLLADMQRSIDESNRFITDMKSP
jgi:Skp family chaperone for outer membrane proteins